MTATHDRKQEAIMGMWSFYFLSKLFLYFRGSINLDLKWNLAFLAFLLVPAPERLARSRAFRVARTLVSLVLAFLLLWHDSWLTPLFEAGSFLAGQGMPSLGFLLYFFLGFYSFTAVAALAALLLFSYIIRRYRIATAAGLAALLVAASFYPVSGHTESVSDMNLERKAEKIDDIGKYLESFYSDESERAVLFRKPSSPQPEFDIIIMHVCSLSWSDLKEIKQTDDPFFKQFDLMFTDFNSATSYSNPAVMRLLQANCGQRSHAEIHNPAPKPCYLFETLSTLGYETYFSMSHDGRYGNFTEDVKKNGLQGAIALPPANVTQQAIFFDNTPLYGDYDVLQKWLERRKKSSAPKAALYYNSVLLHAGSHWVDEKSKWWKRDRVEQFMDVESVLLKDLNRFMAQLKTTGKNYVVVFLPEHGRALHTTPIQGSDLRDIPLPAITKVPVGIKFIGPKFNNATVSQKQITKPTSYLAVSWILSKFIEKSPFGADAVPAEELASKVPKTDFVAENIGNKIVEINGRYFYYGKEKKWTLLKEGQLN